jgi:hypothetical protein
VASPAAAASALDGAGAPLGPPPGVDIASPVFWRYPLRASRPGSKRGPPLRFLDLSDNGLSASHVWRACLVLRKHCDRFRFLDLVRCPRAVRPHPSDPSRWP